MKLLLYCTKSKPYLYDQIGIRNILDKKYKIFNTKQLGLDSLLLNGKIVAECDFEVEEILYLPNMENVKKHKCYCCIFEDKIKNNFNAEDYSNYFTEGSDDNYIIYYSKLTATQLHNYLQGKNGYAIHIKNLHIFDEPYELSDFVKSVNKMEVESINKAPQSMMYAYSKDFPNVKGYFASRQEYVLISIRPEWLCKILNGEKTIEVRKKVLKGML